MGDGVEMATEILATVEHADAEGMLNEVERESQMKESLSTQTAECSLALDGTAEEMNAATRSDSNPIVTSVQQKKVMSFVIQSSVHSFTQFSHN